MPSPFRCSPVIRECLWNKTQIEKKNPKKPGFIAFRYQRSDHFRPIETMRQFHLKIEARIEYLNKGGQTSALKTYNPKNGEIDCRLKAS